jgi:Ca-activated chloride channel family protein
VKRRWATATAMLAGAVSVWAYSVAVGAADEPKTFRSESRLVLLDVSVRDRHGGFVSGLSKQDFSVEENGRPQKITVFDHDDLPVTVGILVDESWSMTPKRADVLTAARIFIESSNRHDEIFVLNFNDRVTPGLPASTLFSDSIQQLSSALYRGVPQGKTALYDAVIAGLNQLELGKRERKALVVVSDGGDNASEHNRREMLADAKKSIATIYTVGLLDPQDPDRDPAILRQLAKITGGDCYLPAAATGVVPVCRRIAQDMRARYTVGYVPQEESGTGSLRRIRIRVAGPAHDKLTIRTRTSYHFDEIEDQKKK